MSRERLVEGVVDVILEGTSHNGLDCGPDPTPLVDVARAVLDAVLPQVSTVAGLEALPGGTFVSADGSPYLWQLIGDDGLFGRCANPMGNDEPGRFGAGSWLSLLKDFGPLTVVWRP